MCKWLATAEHRHAHSSINSREKTQVTARHERCNALPAAERDEVICPKAASGWMLRDQPRCLRHPLFTFAQIRRFIMNWDTVKGQWKQVKGKIREKWGKLTDDDLETISGQKDQLVGKLQQRYGLKKDQAEKEIDDFCRTW
jgi:uncharacterized protein YjbJ (UPF0337 family)